MVEANPPPNPGAADFTAFCRDCGTPARTGEKRCARCRSPRLLTHPELSRLSIAHIDCDAFYAAIEKRDDPTLAGRPVIVGGGRRGVVLTACYIARQFGPRSAMPMFKALSLCPDAVVVRPNMAKYAAEGRRVRALMQSVTPLVEAVSIDEAYLDLTGTERLHGASPALTLARLARRIEAEIGVTVSIGLSFHRLLAKIASGLDKPRGFTVIGRMDATAVIDPMPIRELPGIGPSAEKGLTARGISTVGALRLRRDRTTVAPHASLYFDEIETGRNGRPVVPDHAAKSISAETTFARDLSDAEALAAQLWPLCERVSGRLKASSQAAGTVQLVLRTTRFRRIARRRTIAPPTQLAAILFEVATALLHEFTEPGPFRLIGVGTSGLVPASAADQPDLLDDGRARKAKLERAIDSVRAKLGPDAIRTGRKLPPA